MNRRDFIKLLERNGWHLLRDGANHDIYTNGTSIEPVSRHREIDEKLVKAIMRRQKLQ